MKSLLPVVLAITLSTFDPLALFATEPAAPAARPAAQATTISPQIDSDRRVTFRLKAPGATEVSVAGQKIAKVALAKDGAGVWTVTVGPIEPGVWEYSFTVDGMQLIDPGNPAVKPQRAPRTSILHIPAQPLAPWDFRADAAHGAMHWHDYFAKTLNRQRRLHVYTPPGYERSGETKYPVLYLVHGFSDNDAAWSVHGKAHWILDGLIGHAKAQPMIVVMPDGHPLPPESAARESYGSANLEAFEREMVGDILPLIEATYRVRPEPAGRALAGLSMGGGHTLFTGLKHLDRFSALGAFSAGVPGDDRLESLFADSTAVNGALKLFWIACGKDDFLIERNRKLDATLTTRGIRHTWVETEGDHSWPIWRRYLTEFAPLLFIEKK